MRAIVLTWMLLVASSPAWTQDQRGSEPGPSQNQTPQGQSDAPVKRPPPPLFPRHRRGFYVNSQNIEVIDATPQSPPLESDDPGVPDKGEYEINLLTEADLSPDDRRFDLFEVDANYGIEPKLFGRELPTQVKLESPIAAGHDDGSSFKLGVGAVLFGLKFNFYNSESKGLSMSVYPQIEFATAGSAEKGLADPGQTLILPFLLARKYEYLTLVFNAGIEKPLHDPEREVSGIFGVGVGRAFTRKLAVMTEVRAESGFGFDRDRLLSANLGVIYGVRHIISYARVGHSLFADDGRHFFVAVGIKLIIDTAAKPTK